MADDPLLSDELEDGEADLSALSPFKVLAKTGAASPGSISASPSLAPAPAPASAPIPSPAVPRSTQPLIQPSIQPASPSSNPVLVPNPVVTPPANSSVNPASIATSVPEPVPVGLGPIPSREELLKQAAQAPATSFVLPENIDEEIKAPTPQPIPVAIPAPAPSQTASPTPAPVPSPIQPPTPIPAAKPVSTPVPPVQNLPPVPPQMVVSTPTPVAPKPVLKPSPNLASTASPTPPKAPLQVGLRPTPQGQAPINLPPNLNVGVFPEKPSWRSRLPLILSIGLVVILLLVTGLGYVLAGQGTRVPVFYTLRSGLPTSSSEANSLALNYVNAQTSYSISGSVEINELKDDGTTVIPAVSTSPTVSPSAVTSPTSSPSPSISPTASSSSSLGDDIILSDDSDLSAGSTSVIPVSQLKSQYTNLVYDGMDGIVGDMGLTFNNKVTEQVSFKIGDQHMRLYADGETNPELTAINNRIVKQILIYPVLHPASLAELLGAAVSETSYSTVASGNPVLKAAQITYSVDTTKLKNLLPDGAEPQSAAIQAVLSWKTDSISAATPYGVAMTAKFKYQNKLYSIQVSQKLAAWNPPLSSASSTGLAAVSDLEQTPVVLSPASLIGQLGIYNLYSLPNTITEANWDLAEELLLNSVSGSTPEPTASPSPSASISASPAVSPSPSSSSTVSPSPSTTATATPSPSPTALTITPVVISGKGVVAVSGALDTNPPLPSQPAGTDAKARDAQRALDLKALKTALTNYKTVFGSYPVAYTPVQSQTLAALFSALIPTYINQIPVDPLNARYWYGYQSDGSSFQVTAIVEDFSNVLALQGVAFKYIVESGN